LGLVDVEEKNAELSRLLDSDINTVCRKIDEIARNVLRGFLSARHDSQLDDLVQVTVVSAWRSINRGKRPARNLEAWVGRIARRRFVDYLRRQTVKETQIDKTAADLLEDNSQAFVTSIECQEEMERILATLSPDERVIVSARAQDPPLTYEEISELIGLSVQAVHGKIQRLRRRARKRFPDVLTALLLALLAGFGGLLE